jgi:hypothetical protein
MDLPVVNSETVGEPARFRTFAELEALLNGLPAAPTDRGAVALLVSRREEGRRHVLPRTLLTPDLGMPGDTWGRRPSPKPEAQLTVMELAVAELIANGQPLTLFGDNLFLTIDLSTPNLPIGTRLRVGGAVLEVTPKEHNGCHKFRGRFGTDALRFVSTPPLRHRNLRGIYMRVIDAGEIGPGDPVEIIAPKP